MLDDTEESSVKAGSTKKIKVGDLKKNDYVQIKNRPCKIMEISSVDQSPVKIVGLDIFTGKKMEDSFSLASSADEPIVARKEYTLVNIADDGYCSLVSESSDAKEDLKLPDGELGKSIRASYDKGSEVSVTVMSALGEEQIVSAKVIPEN